MFIHILNQFSICLPEQIKEGPFRRIPLENIRALDVFGLEYFGKISLAVSICRSKHQNQNVLSHKTLPILYIMEYPFPSISLYQSFLKSEKLIGNHKKYNFLIILWNKEPFS